MKKKIISLSLVLCLIVSLAVPTFAANYAVASLPQDITVDTIVEGEAAAQIVAELKMDGAKQARNQITDSGLTSEEQRIVREFNDFMGNRLKTANVIPTEADIEVFIEYAIDNGIIEDTPQTRAAVAIAVVRASMHVVATAGGVLGYKMSETLLKHSLQNNPSMYTMSRNTTYSNQVKRASAHTSLINSVKTKLRSQGGTLYSQTGSVTLNSTTDLHLALNRASYILGAEKINGRWDIYVRYYDIYDFAPSDWADLSLSALASDALNQYGYMAQSVGAIVPYSIEIYTLDVY